MCRRYKKYNNQDNTINTNEIDFRGIRINNSTHEGDMLCSINELVDEILSIYCLEKQQRKMAIAEENEILSEEAKKAGWKSGVMNI